MATNIAGKDFEKQVVGERRILRS